MNEFSSYNFSVQFTNKFQISSMSTVVIQTTTNKGPTSEILT